MIAESSSDNLFSHIPIAMKIIPLAVHFLVFYLQLCLSAHTSNNGSFNDEHEALLVFKNSITSDPNKVLSSWDANTNVCNWTGISCNKLMRVTEIDLESMGLVGYISPFLGNLSFLESLNVYDNSFHGVIPELCQKLSNLQELRLPVNQLTGSIPTSLRNCSNLKELHLWGNQLSAPIPTSLANCSNLQVLNLRENQLSGSIPSLANCSNLQVLNLWGNQLSGPIPSLPNCNLQQLSLDQNHLSGPIPTSLGNCSSLEQLSLSENQFRGPIPTSLGNCSNLLILFLWGNQLSGPIPTSLGNCSKLEILYLTLNNLTGTVPLQLGEIPKRGPLTNLTAPPFKGYPGPSGGFWHFHKLFKYMIYVIPALIMFGIYVLFLYTYLFQKGSVEQPSIEFQHPRISYKELSTATSRFGKGNLLGVGGVGSVYKGVLDNGTLIAVKALDLENEAAHKSFSIECQVLSKAKHRNIIKVITSCSNLDFKDTITDSHGHCLWFGISPS
ncbi:LRR receptor-like serine/threonine-protein kinase GSO1 [Cryptomeria japonica]|uniref:LRR receptor-like serine/threonine-protein kinase GSO1 n=1 Tax=Cryptomeria japonica TaxID=3369 RepID=UPI0027D9FFD6|nr:LRR receptor-like serine/threonine-protein kinase GSO1 [Cryptomeria japonica]